MKYDIWYHHEMIAVAQVNYTMDHYDTDGLPNGSSEWEYKEPH